MDALPSSGLPQDLCRTWGARHITAWAWAAVGQGMVLFQLRSRFEMGIIYTSVWPNVLVCMNPLGLVPSLYTPEVEAFFRLMARAAIDR
jgi:hypothetical protein